jgi:putative transposase
VRVEKKGPRCAVDEVIAVRNETKHPLKAICETLKVPRSTVYGRKSGDDLDATGKRGPKTAISDDNLLEEIRKVIGDSPFTGEGYKKVKARLKRERGIKVGKARVNRLMRENNLLAPCRKRHQRGDPTHSGTITASSPDVMWGTDGTKFPTVRDGWCWVFIAIDHCSLDIPGWHVAKKGDRFAALEPIKRGVRARWKTFEADIASGLKLRHDWGTQYQAHDFQNEIAFLGIESSPAYVSEPETNGIAERFMRTLREQVLDGARFETVAEAEAAIAEFIALYNRKWLIARHGYRTPLETREALAKAA